MQENPVCKELSSQPSASLCKRPAEQAIRTYIRVFQNFWGNGNQRFLGTTFAPGRRETLRFAKKLRFLLSPGLQRWLGPYIIHTRGLLTAMPALIIVEERGQNQQTFIPTCNFLGKGAACSISCLNRPQKAPFLWPHHSYM